VSTHDPGSSQDFRDQTHASAADSAPRGMRAGGRLCAVDVVSRLCPSRVVEEAGGPWMACRFG
jgi:hypothetical protein